METRENNLIKEYSSFRDPDGIVFSYHERIFRAISDSAYQTLKTFAASPLKTGLEKSGDIITTKLSLDDATLIQRAQNEFPEFQHFIEHERIPIITYPYEWTYSMLCDAALFHLNLQLKLLESHFTLKDASSFNIQFIGAKPVFIDILSIEPLKTSYWTAYNQFCRMFFYPIVLFGINNVDSKNYFLSKIDGLTVEETYQRVGWLKALHPDFLLHLFLQNFFQTRQTGKPTTSLPHGSGDHTKPHLQTFLINNLKKIITKRSAAKPLRNRQWTTYSENNSYAAGEKEKKKQFVENFLRSTKPSTVLDLGCNTGEYSLLASKYAYRTIAVDGDHNCVDQLYRRIKNTENILPMWMDISNPSPSIGFQNKERQSFFSRIQCDAVFTLALVHHLLIVNGAQPFMIHDCLLSLTKTYLLVEYISPADPQFLSLLGPRTRDYSFFTEDFFKALFSKKTNLLASQKITATRTLFLFKKKE